MARRRHTSDEDAQIDLTPMLDMTFILLIFFIVTTSFVKEAGIEVNRPSASTAEKQERGNILIAITPTGEIFMDKRSVDIRAVRANVERMHAENPEGSVVIIADRASETGVLVEVMDQVRLAGVENVSIAASQSGT